MHPILFKLKYQNPRRFENLSRDANVFEDDLQGCWSVVLSDERGHSWIETKFTTKQAAEHRKQIFIKGD
jgi:hypothetical protein